MSDAIFAVQTRIKILKAAHQQKLLEIQVIAGGLAEMELLLASLEAPEVPAEEPETADADA